MRSFSFSLICLLLSVVTCSAGAPGDKRFAKAIAESDIPYECKIMDVAGSAEFWKNISEYDEQLISFERKMNRPGGSMKNAIRRVADMPRFYPNQSQYLVESAQAYCDSIVNVMGLLSTGIPYSVHVVGGLQRNVFTALTDSGYATCITSALFAAPGMNDSIIKGYVAREFSNALLRLIERDEFHRVKQEKSWMIATVALTATAVVATALTMPDNVVYYDDSVNNSYNTTVIQTTPEEPTSIYFYDYTEKSQYAAELLAFRYMQYCGIEESYIEGLKYLGADNDLIYSFLPNRLNISTRINFLDYVKTHPELGNLKNNSMRSKRLRADARKSNRD